MPPPRFVRETIRASLGCSDRSGRVGAYYVGGMTTLAIKRVQEPADDADGFRVLVDRLWPRGISKERARLGVWLKEAGPSNELRTWFGHDPAKFAEFEKRYRAELDDNDAVDELRSILAEHDTVTLVYGAKDTEHNQAVVLRNYLG